MEKIVLGFIAACISINPSSAEAVSYQGHQVWRVVPRSEKVLHILKEAGDLFQLDFWSDPAAINRAVDFRVPPTQANDIRKHLENSGIKIKVNIKDIQKLHGGHKRQLQSGARSSARSLASFDYTIYHDSEEIYQWMDMVVEEYPTLVTKRQIGITYQGRPIFALEFKKRPASNPKPVIFIDSLMHSREWISAASLLFIFKEMLTNEDFAHMMDDVDWHFVPMVNVDGYVETWIGDRLWRKTRSTGPSSACAGTDPNRNWDAHWSGPGASPHPCSIAYYGPTAFSESEVRHLASYFLGLGTGKVDAYIDTHSYTQLILYPYGYTASPAEHDKILNVTGKLMSDAIRSVHGKEYIYGSIATTIYPSSGSSADWTYDVAKTILSFGYELRDTGEYGFLLPEDQIVPTAEEYLAGIEALKNYVLENFSSP